MSTGLDRALLAASVAFAAAANLAASAALVVAGWRHYAAARR